MVLNEEQILASAKINLFLHVGARQLNGLHLIDSLMVFADQNVADHIQFVPAKDFKLEITGEFSSNLGLPEEDLVTRAVHHLQRLTDSKLNYRVKLTKQIPVSAGLGGGSADAGAILRQLGSKLNIADETLLGIARSLGSDVPACFYNEPCFVGGQGEKVRLVKDFPRLSTVLVNCRLPCPTVRVFERFDQTGRSYKSEMELVPDRFEDATALIKWLIDNTTNDLETEAVKLVPEISEVLKTLQSFSSIRLVRVSGSGATCFGLCDDFESAQKVVSVIAECHPNWWVKAAHLGAGKLGSS